MSRYPGKLINWATTVIGLALLLLSASPITGSLTQRAIVSRASSEHTEALKPAALARTSPTRNVTVRANGRGNPRINLSDGHDLFTSYSGPSLLTRALEQNEAQPRSLASADFDEDGTPDLVCGYSYSQSGIVSLLRGNVDAIYSNSHEAQQRRAEDAFTDAPFLAPAHLFALSIEPDFIGAGDFDADGHWDIVAASRKSNGLYLMSGDGTGGLKEARRIVLPGAVTAMVVGEVNRRDGLADVIVAVSGQEGAKALMFEGPEGALKAEPEILDLPAEATALALGQLDDEYTLDLTVVAGSELLLIHGRDRRRYWGEKSRGEVPQASISRRRLPFAVKSIATGDFSGNYGADIVLLSEDGAVRVLTRERKKAKEIEQWSIKELTTGNTGDALAGRATDLVCAKVSVSPKDDLLVLDAWGRQLNILAGGSYEAQTVGRAHSSADGLRRETVSLDVEGGPVAVLPMRLNVDALSDLIILRSGQSAAVFVASAAASTITVNSAADNNVRDNGLNLREAILLANGTLTTESLSAAEKAQVSGALGPDQLDAINFHIGSGPQTISPTSPLPDITDPAIIDGTTQPGFTGTPLIELDGTQVQVPVGDLLLGGNGLRINAGSSTVRGLTIKSFPEAFLNAAITIIGRGGNRVEGCFIHANKTNGVLIVPRHSTPAISGNNIIGGTSQAARNIISDNHGFFGGVVIASHTTTGDTSAGGNQVMGNIISANNNGVFLFDGSTNTIGGATPGAGNTISGNRGFGFWSNGFATLDNLVQGNVIELNGINSTYGGIFVNGTSKDMIGGTTKAASNVISGNRGNGVWVNAFDHPDAPKPQSTIVVGNIISSNGEHGILLGGFSAQLGRSFGSTGCLLDSNFIGTDPSGNRLGNGQDGIFIDNKCFKHTVSNNVVAFNGRSGICIPDKASSDQIPADPGKENLISQNSIYSNAALGIDLQESGVTNNDIKDPDDGANTVQNFPVLTSAATDGFGATLVQGNLNSTPGETFTIEFFSSPGEAIPGIQTSAVGLCNPQGRTYIGTVTVTTDGNGNAPITITFPRANPGVFINCTATNRANNTSEFSACAQSILIVPSIQQITVTSKIVAVGFGFVGPVEVSIIDKDSQGRERVMTFSQAAKVKGGTKVIQRGSLVFNGTSISLEEAVPAGKVVQIKFRNGNGGEISVPFRK